MTFIEWKNNHFYWNSWKLCHVWHYLFFWAVHLKFKVLIYDAILFLLAVKSIINNEAIPLAQILYKLKRCRMRIFSLQEKGQVDWKIVFIQIHTFFHHLLYSRSKRWERFNCFWGVTPGSLPMSAYSEKNFDGYFCNSDRKTGTVLRFVAEITSKIVIYII